MREREVSGWVNGDVSASFREEVGVGSERNREVVERR
jgi:hypothetical protein